MVRYNFVEAVLFTNGSVGSAEAPLAWTMVEVPKDDDRHSPCHCIYCEPTFTFFLPYPLFGNAMGPFVVLSRCGDSEKCIDQISEGAEAETHV